MLTNKLAPDPIKDHVIIQSFRLRVVICLRLLKLAEIPFSLAKFWSPECSDHNQSRLKELTLCRDPGWSRASSKDRARTTLLLLQAGAHHCPNKNKLKLSTRHKCGSSDVRFLIVMSSITIRGKASGMTICIVRKQCLLRVTQPNRIYRFNVSCLNVFQK